MTRPAAFTSPRITDLPNPPEPTGGILGSNQLALLGPTMLDPWDSALLNPASIDVTLGEEIRVYNDVASVGYRPPWAINGWQVRPRRGAWYTLLDWLLGCPVAVIDAAKPMRTTALQVKRGEPFLLRPGIGYLAHTTERISAGHHVLVVDGKSSVGRLFVKVHETAGYIDPGFVGGVTLEMTVEHPTILYGGMRIGQVRAHTVVGEARSYAERGHYVGAAARGAVPSQAWRQLREDGIVMDSGR
jgi:deoxycytidine triphosphate deaminase